MSRWKYQFSFDHWSQTSWAQPVFRWIKLSDEWWVLLLSNLGVKPTGLLGEKGNSVLEADLSINPNQKKVAAGKKDPTHTHTPHWHWSSSSCLSCWDSGPPPPPLQAVAAVAAGACAAAHRKTPWRRVPPPTSAASAACCSCSLSALCFQWTFHCWPRLCRRWCRRWCRQHRFRLGRLRCFRFRNRETVCSARDIIARRRSRKEQEVENVFGWFKENKHWKLRKVVVCWIWIVKNYFVHLHWGNSIGWFADVLTDSIMMDWLTNKGSSKSKTASSALSVA